MSTRFVVRILLSLLLLLSQQMAFTHALSHWGGAGNVVRADTAASTVAVAAADEDAFKASLADQNCDQCLSFAQLAGALSNTPRWFAVDAVGAEAVAGCVSRPAHARTVCVFQSRAPPVVA
jgi:hypothetical protein